MDRSRAETAKKIYKFIAFSEDVHTEFVKRAIRLSTYFKQAENKYFNFFNLEKFLENEYRKTERMDAAMVFWTVNKRPEEEEEEEKTAKMDAATLFWTVNKRPEEEEEEEEDC